MHYDFYFWSRNNQNMLTIGKKCISFIHYPKKFYSLVANQKDLDRCTLQSKSKKYPVCPVFLRFLCPVCPIFLKFFCPVCPVFLRVFCPVVLYFLGQKWLDSLVVGADWCLEQVYVVWIFQFSGGKTAILANFWAFLFLFISFKSAIT